jgi:hypothetical protein
LVLVTTIWSDAVLHYKFNLPWWFFSDWHRIVKWSDEDDKHRPFRNRIESAQAISWT